MGTQVAGETIGAAVSVVRTAHSLHPFLYKKGLADSQHLPAEYFLPVRRAREILIAGTILSSQCCPLLGGGGEMSTKGDDGRV